MKKIFYFAIASLLFACAKPEKPIDYLVFSGTIENNSADSLFVMGKDFKKGIAIQEDGSFSDTLRVEDSYYSFRIGRESSALYLQKGKDLSLNINPEKFDESIVYKGNGAKENNYLAQKYLLMEQIIPSGKDLFMQSEKDFIAQIQKLRDETKALLNQPELEEAFIIFQTQEIDYEYASNIVSYRRAHAYYNQLDEFEVSETFYDNQIDFSLDDEEAYKNSSNYRQLVNSVFSTNVNNMVEDKDSSIVGACKTVIQFFANQHIKNEVINSYSRSLLKPTNELDQALIFLKDNVTNTDYIVKYDDKYDQLLPLLAGKPSPTFQNYENHNGDSTSLADFKGKYVYIDVWATWCGPCIREIPSLKEIEAAYHDKNIAFLSISIDDKEDHETWVNMVREKELGGTQLYANNSWKSEFTRAYLINSIPRFIIIDPEGNIVDADAKRPSNPELVEEFEALGI